MSEALWVCISSILINTQSSVREGTCVYMTISLLYQTLLYGVGCRY